eukprot:CAMPEP_0184405296 /NCGR_PEP_ID=MMETSP0738-20130409/563_1 /TAXON_ID=385413 /ORGANISM="Thalassiosira miniscula, Strain CCMP1093" /LENGTH=67 /DNA_ID=CAMNT_0026761711 /DNA_START=35 /DNA_END=238 /DNA_ORIENTATION=+
MSEVSAEAMVAQRVRLWRGAREDHGRSGKAERERTRQDGASRSEEKRSGDRARRSERREGAKMIEID